MKNSIFCVLTIGLIFGLTKADIVLNENGYEGVVVAIGKGVPENPTIIENIKKMFEDGSKVLFEATRNRAFFKEVTIVVPPSWEKREEYVSTNISGWLPTAAIRVDLPHPEHGDFPYTLQLGGCGEPGAYIHLTPTYTVHMYKDLLATFGSPGKVLVHEWSHLRWGVFDEYGEHGTASPAFYIGEDQQMHVTGCTQDLKGWMRTQDGAKCHADTSGMPDASCHFFPAENNNVSGSFMNLYFLESVSQFCDNDSIPHNIWAPNAHNLQCGGQSVWGVITQHEDFRNANFPTTNLSSHDLKPKFRVVQEAAKEKPRFILLLDLSSSMDQFMEQLYQAVVRFVRDLIPNESEVAVVSFANKSTLHVNFTLVQDNREDIVKKLPATYNKDGFTAIGGALHFCLQLVEDSHVKSEGLMIILITDGEQTILPLVETVLPDVKRAGIIINTVSFGPNATDSLESWAKETGGASYYHSTGSRGSLSSLDALLFDAIKSSDKDEMKQLQQVHRDVVFVKPGRKNFVAGEVVLDSTVGHETRFTFTENIDLYNLFSIVVTLTSPTGEKYGNGSSSDIYRVDNVTRTITFTFQEATVGKWVYNISTSGYIPFDEVLVAVTSHPSSKTHEDPIRVSTWMSSSEVVYPAATRVYAFVSQGYSTVINANVTAVIEPPTEAGSVQLPLLDNGVGADIRAGDGIYSAFFTQFSANGRYSVSVVVSTSNRTAKLQAYKPNSPRSQSLYQYQQRPLSNAIRRLKLPVSENSLPDPVSQFAPDDLVPSVDPNGNEGKGGREFNKVQVEPFTRFISGGIFKVNNYQPGDMLPPGRVTDLAVSVIHLFDVSVTLNWTSPGDDLYHGTASTLELRYHETTLIYLDFLKGHVVSDSHLTSGDLTPRPAGDPHVITVKILGRSVDSLEGRPLFFALKARDEVGNSGDISNIATAYFPLKKYTYNLNEEQKLNAISGLVVLIVLGVLVIFIVAFIASVKFMHVRHREKKREQELIDGGCYR
ncbi:calcium-activated chloride channel regulator 1-like isoform X2 [Penaeus japonicus]|uniref:calcium-activated chloride channel regulator 1-like isoform X1 n=1 Tax=Penaeus japonicus TaxID=27405 RepID=UPI001C71751E|nr:calcium-activated chloride channel regulator 1-like isoform X1 [Penaeus japonicus]XP_042864498.1 calcium-activated chloride channel regulator 1-like isoform X2 [Penaeus japonicus]